jgi:hypothetical protein
MNVVLSHLLDHFVVVFDDGIGWSHNVCVVEKLCKCYDENEGHSQCTRQVLHETWQSLV